VALLALISGGPIALASPQQDATKGAAQTAETPTQFYLRYLNKLKED